MKELELKYYFEHMEEFRHNELFENCTYIWEPLSKINDYIKKKIVDKNIQINKAEEIGEFVSIKGNYFIDEGTKIGSNVTIQGPVLIGKNVEIK